MKVLVIGASGATGKLAVAKLLKQGHTVTAFVRNPETMNEFPGVAVVQGDASDAAAVERAVAGQEAVLCAFGPRSLGKTQVQETLMRHLLAAMEKHSVKRLVNLSAWGSGDSRADANLIFKLMRVTLLRNVYEDKERGEALLVRSPVDYVNVRPGRLLNTPSQGTVKATQHGEGLKPSLSRDDLADFMVGQLTANDWVRQSPIVGYA